MVFWKRERNNSFVILSYGYSGDPKVSSRGQIWSSRKEFHWKILSTQTTLVIVDPSLWKGKCPEHWEWSRWWNKSTASVAILLYKWRTKFHTQKNALHKTFDEIFVKSKTWFLTRFSFATRPSENGLDSTFSLHRKETYLYPLSFLVQWKV